MTDDRLDSVSVRQPFDVGTILPTLVIGWTRLLVATDFSEAARTGFRTALGLAKQMRASVDVLHVRTLIEQVELGGILPARERDDKLDALIDTALDELRDEALAAGVPCITSTTEGSVPACIIEHALQVGASSIVVGNQRRAGFPPIVLGGVTSRLVARSPIPVVVVPHGKEAA